MASKAYQNLVSYCARLRKLGMNDAVVSPGSRNAPVIKALEATGFAMHSCVDERSAAFIALGIAKQTQQRVVLSCTSGSAGLNYYPAIAEAFYSHTPLLVLTADRPALQIDQWEGQSIRQTEVFSNHVRHQSTLDLYDDEKFAEYLMEVETNLGSQIPGPVHVNIPLREPLYDFDDVVPMIETSKALPKKSFNISKSQIESYLNADWQGKKIFFFSGMEVGEDVRFEPMGNPYLCDVTSSAGGNIQLWDALLFTHIKNQNALKSLQPEILVTSGNTTVSKGLRIFLKENKPRYHYHIGTHNEVGDMFETKPNFISAEQLPKLAIDGNSSLLESNYFHAWKQMETQFSNHMKALDWQSWNQFALTSKLLNAFPETCIFHFSNSMPIRYASLLAIKKVLCNRGTSGIDGCTSTAVGYALTSEQTNILVTGDVAMLYDINALWFNELPKNLKIVVLNNHGGGIFEMIDGPKKMGSAQKYQTTPHQRNIKSLAEHFGIPYFCALNNTGLNDAIDNWMESECVSILELQTQSVDDQHFIKQFKAIAE